MRKVELSDAQDSQWHGDLEALIFPRMAAGRRSGLRIDWRALAR
jgi:hypothetical protein